MKDRSPVKMKLWISAILCMLFLTGCSTTDIYNSAIARGQETMKNMQESAGEMGAEEAELRAKDNIEKIERQTVTRISLLSKSYIWTCIAISLTIGFLLRHIGVKTNTASMIKMSYMTFIFGGILVWIIAYGSSVLSAMFY